MKMRKWRRKCGADQCGEWPRWAWIVRPLVDVLIQAVAGQGKVDEEGNK